MELSRTDLFSDLDVGACLFKQPELLNTFYLIWSAQLKEKNVIAITNLL